MIYQKQEDLIALKIQAKLTHRELAAALGISPGAVGCKLTGFIAIYPEERRIIERICNEAIEKQKSK